MLSVGSSGVVACMENSNCFASIPINMDTPPSPLSTFVTHSFDLLVCICQNYCLEDIRISVLFCVINFEKRDFNIIVLKYFEKIS